MITPALLIQKKRDGGELSREEIHSLISGLMSGEVADYQATAFLMAVFFRNMTLGETVALTEAMLESGERYDLSAVHGAKSDKHSTGGVGDKVSLILAPLAAACGLKVPMMAGRGLGHTGGTIDKLEAISGYQTSLPREKFIDALKKAGCSIIGQNEKIAPADKKLYALRDVTGTIECVPLITASILSKKLAEGTESLVLDIKVGNGAFMKSKEQARKLSKTMIQVGAKLGLPIRAVLSDMSQPLGYAAGNTLEVIECIEILKGDKGLLHTDVSSTDLRELTLQLCAHMLQLGKITKSLAEARKLANQKLSDGSAWKKFVEMVAAHGGDVSKIQNTTHLPLSKKTAVIRAGKKGYITAMDTERLGWLLVEMGGGRRQVTDKIDFGVGFVFHRKLGTQVKTGDPLATVYLPENPKKGSNLSESYVEMEFRKAISITGSRKPVPKLMVEVIGK